MKIIGHIFSFFVYGTFLLFVLLCALYLVIRSDFGQRQLGSISSNIVSSMIEGEIEIERISVSVTGDVSVFGVTLKNGENKVLFLPRARAHVDFESLLNKHLEIEELKLTMPVVWVERNEDGELTLLEALSMKETEVEEEDSSNAKFTFAIGGVVESAEILAPTLIPGRNLQVKASATFELSHNAIFLEAARIQSREGVLNISGRFPFKSYGTLDASVQGTLFGDSIAQLYNLKTQGNWKISASAHGTLDRPILTLASEGRYDGYPFNVNFKGNQKKFSLRGSTPIRGGISLAVDAIPKNNFKAFEFSTIRFGNPESGYWQTLSSAFVSVSPLEVPKLELSDGNYKILVSYIQKNKVRPVDDLIFVIDDLKKMLPLVSLRAQNLQSESNFRAKAYLSIPELSPLTKWIPAVSEIGGGVHAWMEVTNSLKAPVLDGEIRADNVHFFIPGVRPVRKLNAFVTLKNDSARIEEFSFLTGGRVRASGEVSGLMSPSMTFRINGSLERVVLDPNRNPVMTADGKFETRGEITELKNSIEVILNGVRIWFPDLPKSNNVRSLARDNSIHVIEEVASGGGASEESSESDTPKITEVNVVLQNGFYIQGPDTLLALDGSVKIQTGLQDQNSVIATGLITNVNRGMFTAVGKTFEIDELRIEFPGGPVKDGNLDVAARYETNSSSIKISIDGRLAKPRFQLSSDPPMPESQIVATLIGVGAPVEDTEVVEGEENSLSSRGTTAAANVLGGMLASHLESSVFRGAPVSIGVKVEDSSTKKGTFEVGRYVNPDLFLSFDKNFGTEPEENRNQLRFDYRLSRRWSLEGFYGDAGEGGVDLMWKRRF